jgi:hypothetical protein
MHIEAMDRVGPSSFPIKRENQILSLSLGAGLMMALLSAISLLFPELVYPSPKLIQQYLANDLVNLIIGVPIFMVAFWLIWRKKFLGWLLLPGVLVYVIYNYLAYVLGRPLDPFGILFLGLVLLSVYTLIVYLGSVDHEEIKSHLEKTVWVKYPSWTLIVFGAGFFSLACYQIINGLIQGTIPPLGENAVSAADVVVSTVWFINGVALLRRKPRGYTLGLGSLFVTCTLFFGLIAFMLMAPSIAGRELVISEVVQVLIMSLIGIIPTGLFWRGVVIRSAD